MQNISAINNDNTFNNIQHLPNIEQINNHNEEVSTTRMGIDLLRAEHFSQLDVNAHGVYANGLDWSYSKALCSKIWKKMKFWNVVTLFVSKAKINEGILCVGVGWRNIDCMQKYCQKMFFIFLHYFSNF